MKSWMPWLLVVALVGAVAYAMGSSNRPPEPIAAAPAPPLAPPDDSEGQGEQEGMGQDMGHGGGAEETLTGTIREHKDVSQYTYLRLDTDAGEAWAAVYRAPVKDGAKVTVLHASSIHSFHSKELNRDFDTIWFGMLPGYEAAPPTGAAGAASAASAKGAAGGDMGPSRSAGVAGARAIADLAKRAPGLEGSQVTVTGKVVKENDGIMGRNWIHIQDGTGSAADKTNDVLVTSDATAKLGDQVVATGTVKTKQDFGSGYAYEFMLEKASVTPAGAR
ncbi:MAG: nucleotide-binding protein [Polyangiaceae bacterium]